jgi:hypothetical protein
MATAASSFSSLWRPGRRVQELASPHRKGTIRAVKGSGNNAQVTVGLDGRAPVTLHPPQLKLI